METKTMWDQRYSTAEYVYGTNPNRFLVEYAGFLKPTVLSLSEGEGRNAVYLASLGMDVHCIDNSEVGLKKAQALAESRNVTIRTEKADLEMYSPLENAYGSVISIFAHLSSVIRKRLYPLVENCLVREGTIILEAYSERQLEFNTGGPKDKDMLMTCEKIQQEFPGIEPILLREIERDVCEGKYHTGRASVVQFVGKKKTTPPDERNV